LQDELVRGLFWGGQGCPPLTVDAAWKAAPQEKIPALQEKMPALQEDSIIWHKKLGFIYIE
jgi:hypothetical protein